LTAACYLKELKILVIYGRALSAAQAAIPPWSRRSRAPASRPKSPNVSKAAIKKEVEALKAGQAAPAQDWLRYGSDTCQVQAPMMVALQKF